ncbi:pilus assembly protein PilP [Propionivibrio limicola]|uniref:pilus assembly protein PilP n=1 Tax=Propionivibrio limicola TaxID=167645 RepID=UPI001290F08F|nr:pilus assembly protein PilP [Propionivibrio limicola]
MRKIALLLTPLVLVACSAGNEHEDLRQWMNEVSKGIKGKIPPLPQVKVYEPSPYDVANLLEPFSSSKISLERKKGSAGGVQPDLDRPREPLESYPLESLRYVGVMSRNKLSYAIIQADGVLHHVRVGNYMGQNFGVVTRISETEVALKELVQDAAGDWVERESKLLLQEQEVKK